MALGHASRKLWNNLVAPVVSRSWYPYDSSRMDEGSERPALDTTIFSDRGTALVYHIGRFRLDWAHHTVRWQMDAGCNGCGHNCNRGIFSVRPTRPCAASAQRLPPSFRQLLLAAAATRGRRGVCALPP